jgi:hypothetical protein
MQRPNGLRGLMLNISEKEEIIQNTSISLLTENIGRINFHLE